MRKFEGFIYRKLSNTESKMIFIDLSYIENSRGHIDISIGIKEKFGGLIGTTWKTSQLDVEDDFSIKEFLLTCKKYTIPCSVFCGDDESYLL